MQQYYYKIAKSRCECVDGVSGDASIPQPRRNCLLELLLHVDKGFRSCCGLAFDGDFVGNFGIRGKEKLRGCTWFI